MRVNKKVRMNRLFGGGRCLDVAIDHGVCNEPSFLNGLEDIQAVVKALVSAAPDAIQMNYGQADLLQDVPGVDQFGWASPTADGFAKRRGDRRTGPVTVEDRNRRAPSG